MIRQRAAQQHVDYLRQLEPPRPARTVEVEAQLQTSIAAMRTSLNHPDVTRQPSESELAFDTRLRSGEDFHLPNFVGKLGSVDFPPFGKIEVWHGDIFDFSQADAWMVPMSPNLLPYRGLGLEVFDRGGVELVQKTFQVVQDSGKNSGLQAGDIVLVPGPERFAKAGGPPPQMLFTIMPWFWEGSPMDASKRLRECIRLAFLAASGHDGSGDGFKSVVLPNLGGGIYGYEPRDSSHVLVEEAVEALLQIEASTPRYTLETISFVESSREAAEALHDALTEASHRWLPQRRLTSAPQWWGQQTRRLIVLPAAPNFFWKRFRVKFKKRHGIKKRARHDYMGNVKPWLWRAQRVQQPPPMMVYQNSGEIAARELQPKARPYYFRGVSHWLFPSRRGGFHSMRRSARGQWVGLLQQYKIREAVRPRM
mmetsp:Transcript_80950/g.142784  ORF Transcript_80950/g.142784 Transcript_80950/m.142784 type:complete len:423 (-) Transcript_80950:47-1315(-)